MRAPAGHARPLPSAAVAALLAAALLAPAPAARAGAAALPPDGAAARPAPWAAPPLPEDAAAPVLPGTPLAAAEMLTPLSLASATVGGFDSPPDSTRTRKHRRAPEEGGLALGPERARVLLRSLTIPGWGQASLGAKYSARAFLVAEAGIWGAFTAFHIQEAMRTDSYQRTAQLFAGIDLRGRDDEFKRIVGAFTSSDQYNLLVVARDAANLYLSDPNNPDIAGYRAYLAAHSLSGTNGWRWSDAASFERYGSQRRDAQRASLRANTALGLAIANRIISALHAARVAGHAAPAAAHAWRFEVAPERGDPTAFHAALRTTF